MINSRMFLVLMLFVCVGSVLAVSVTPDQGNGASDSVYGNSVTLGAIGGETVSIWNGALSTAEFTETLFAADAQIADLIDWVQNQPDGRSLTLSSGSYWQDGSITHKFVAPTGTVFSGGFLRFTGQEIWGGGGVTLSTSSGYGNNGWGLVEPSGVIGSNFVDMPDAWTIYNGDIDIPVGVSEFYLTIAESIDYKTTWGMSLNAYDATVVAVPEPATICLLGLGGLSMLRKRRA